MRKNLPLGRKHQQLKSVITRSIFQLKMQQYRLAAGLRPDLSGSLQRSADIAGLRGAKLLLSSKGRGMGRKWVGDGRGGEKTRREREKYSAPSFYGSEIRPWSSSSLSLGHAVTNLFHARHSSSL